MRIGDITGFDDAEVIDFPDDVPDDNDLVIDLEEEESNDKQ